MLIYLAIAWSFFCFGSFLTILIIGITIDDDWGNLRLSQWARIIGLLALAPASLPMILAMFAIQEQKQIKELFTKEF